MNFKNILFSLFSISIILSSCGDTQTASNDMLKSIPKSVSMVTSIDAGAILEKADFETVKTMEFYQELISETKRYNSTLASVLEDPAQSGVDFSKNMYIAHNLDVNNPEDVFVGIIAGIKDKAALETLINSNSGLKISKQGNYSVGMKGSQSVAWNDEKVVIGMTNSYNDPLPRIDEFFNTKAESSIAEDKDLQKALSGNHDITSWVSSNALANSPALKNALMMASIDPEAAKDNFIHSYVDFNKGSIKSSSDMYLQDALMKDVNLLFKDKTTTDFSSFVPATANSAMTVALDLEGVQQVLQQKGVLMMANFGLKEYGLTVEDIASTFGGDILLFSTPGTGKTPIGTFATSISSKEKLDKFLSLASEYQILEKQTDNLYTIRGTGLMTGNMGGSDAQLLIKGDMIIISASAAVIQKISAGGYSGGDQISKSKIKTLRSNIFSGFADYDDILKNSSDDKMNLDLNLEDMLFSTNRKKGEFNLNFKDKNTNALKQLFESINKIYLAEQKGEI